MGQHPTEAELVEDKSETVYALLKTSKSAEPQGANLTVTRTPLKKTDSMKKKWDFNNFHNTN